MYYDRSTSWLGADSSALPALLSVTSPFANLDRWTAGTWFDAAVDLRHPEGDALTGEVLAILSAVEQRQRSRRSMDELNHRTLVRKILANGVRCHHHRQPSLVAYLRKADGYRGQSAWLSGESLARTVDGLTQAGLLRNTVGERGIASTYHVALELIDIANRHGVTAASLTHRLPPDSLVRLREANSKASIAFAPTEETQGWTGLLDAQNAFYSQQDIALPLDAESEAEWLEHWSGDRGGDRPLLIHPELFKTDLYRMFNNGSFGEGGRMYGGWWINTPKDLRPTITINGQPTVELDFSGCAIRMLYQERGIDYRDDPYHLDAVEAYGIEKGWGEEYFRDAIKDITNALINDCGDGQPERIPLRNGVSFRPGFKRSEVRKLIEEKHIPIADAFGTGAGLRLQRKDSDLALAIITALREQGVVALPVHDSFITAAVNKDNLYRQMAVTYESMFGFKPVIRLPS